MATGFLSLLLTLFFIWLLSFILNDIGDLPGPNYNAIQQRHIPEEKQSAANELSAQLTEIEKQIKRQQEIQNILTQIINILVMMIAVMAKSGMKNIN